MLPRGLFPVAWLLLALFTSSHATAAAPERRPNIVLIMADDLGYGSLGCYGGESAATPHLDRLAAGGLRLTDFHSSGPVCSPTRAALLTGRYPQRCDWVPDADLSPVFQQQRRENPSQRWAWGISPQEVTIASVLRGAGYRTALVGKWHLGYDYAFHPMNYGFDEFRGFMGGNVDYHTHVAGYGLKQLDWWNGRQIENEPGYTTDLLTRYATEFIEQHRDRPFFLYLAHAAPHDPWQGRDQARKKSPAETYREMLVALDASVGTVAAALRTHGLEKNTLLIFCSDNGAQAPRGVPANAPLKGRKGELSEGGHRVPFIASWPGVIAPGTTSDATLMTMDFFPTFARLGAAKIPSDRAIDGTDMLTVLRGDVRSLNRNLHWRFGDAWAVRRGPWKLLGQGATPRTLVNLADDLTEKTNRLEAEPVRVQELLQLHRHWSESAGER
jgi:arylsulfatase A-like enzyme